MSLWFPWAASGRKAKLESTRVRHFNALLKIGWGGNLTAKEMQQIARVALKPARALKEKDHEEGE